MIAGRHDESSASVPAGSVEAPFRLLVGLQTGVSECGLKAGDAGHSVTQSDAKHLHFVRESVGFCPCIGHGSGGRKSVAGRVGKARIW